LNSSDHRALGDDQISRGGRNGGKTAVPADTHSLGATWSHLEQDATTRITFMTTTTTQQVSALAPELTTHTWTIASLAALDTVASR
jgi:hypothetical protein